MILDCPIGMFVLWGDGTTFLFLWSAFHYWFLSFFPLPFPSLKYIYRISLMVQWLSVHLAMQRTKVQPLAWKDLTRCGAAKPCGQLPRPSSRAHVLGPVPCSRSSQHSEDPCPVAREQLPLTAAGGGPHSTQTQYSHRQIDEKILLKK